LVGRSPLNTTTLDELDGQFPLATAMHRTFLLTWHPKRWRWTDLEDALGDLASAGVVHDECG